MKTKNLFLGLSLLAIAGLWTGCSNDDEVIDTSGGDQAISFRTQGGMPQLRATETTKEYINVFVVYGTDDGREGVGSNIFDGVSVARQVDKSFSYGAKRYFTAEADIAQFAAFSPMSENITIAKPSDPSYVSPFKFDDSFAFDYEVKAPDRVSNQPTGKNAQEDLLVAGTTVNIDKSTPGNFNTVNLNFQHALSRIFVKATNDLSEIVIIEGLTLKNLCSTGTITGNPTTDGTTPAIPGTLPAVADALWKWAWAPKADTKTDYAYVLPPSGVSVEENVSTPILVTSKEQGMMVLPQVTKNEVAGSDPEAKLAGGDFALEVLYDIGNLKGQKVYVFIDDDYPFEMGKQYEININFREISDLIEIGFDINVVDGFQPVVDAGTSQLYPVVTP